jgi:hypothetical protein
VIVLLLSLGLSPALSSQPAAAANSSITINAHTCPYGTDLSASIFDLAAACQGSGAFDYTINGSNGYAQQVATSGSPGLVTASGLDPATYYITQGDYSATYGIPVAYCSVSDELGGDVTATTAVSIVNGSQSPIELAVDGYKPPSATRSTPSRRRRRPPRARRRSTSPSGSARRATRPPLR